MCAIFGLDPITSGSVYLNGREVHIKNTRDAINHGIAMVSEDRRTYSSSAASDVYKRQQYRLRIFVFLYCVSTMKYLPYMLY